MNAQASYWRRCSSCKQPIEFTSAHWVCNVSTCNRKRTGLVFCSPSCWDAHLPLMRHRESWAIEKTSPSQEQWRKERVTEASAPRPAQPKPVAARRAPSAAPTPQRREALPRDILIVASKLKRYIRARSGMNTSDAVMAALSDQVRELSDQAIRKAERAGRRTVLDRDFD